MATVGLTEPLRAEYRALFSTCSIRDEFAGQVEPLVNSLASHQARYEAVGGPLNVPWWFIAVVHNMEASQRFNTHLHNGDPLTARTVQEPPGRPKTGQPPFTWEASATDALIYDRVDKWGDWTVAGTLYKLESYNGFGYRVYHPQVKSPYLWSFSSHYSSGKYVKDGRWSDTARSDQCGGAVLLRRMVERRLFGFADEALPQPGQLPLVVRYASSKPSDPAVKANAMALQSWLNTHSGIFVKPDGWPGENTSNAYKAVTGHYLPDDPRG